ncbi:MAG TPA: AMP-binding protein, partial [Gemmatimonadaceae bacterium]|nr:AMP-binding protein [Gemmatimonadaceae bacterium]
MAKAQDDERGQAAAGSGTDEARVLDVVRDLALEVAGARAASAVTPDASLERDVGLGSLERVELMVRLERALGREVGDEILVLDTAREIAAAVAAAPVVRIGPPAPPAAPQPVTALQLEHVTTLAEALRLRAEAEPDRVHVHLHEDPAVHPVTYGALWSGATRIADALAQHGVQHGDKVAIMLPTGVDFLETFMGVLAAGAVAVPLYPPVRLDRISEYLQRQARILANAEARLLVAMPEAAPVAKLLRRDAPALRTIVSVQALRETSARGSSAHEAADTGANDHASADDPALIQYTSGSTGDPKGVLLTHANLMANIRAIAVGVEMRGTDVGVSWLPLYHDMGLIGTWLCTMVQGIPIALMSPLAFLARPERWLWAIHAHRATLSPAPNFAYELCVRRIPDEALTGLDLSCWRCATNGSEPVSEGTLDRFAERFAPYGFRREALMPVYGLAESSVALCFPPVGRGPVIDHVARAPFVREGRAEPARAGDRTAIGFASVGTVIPDHELRVVDERHIEVPERMVGRVEFRGPSCTSGYYHNPEANARTFLPGGWLDSGDLAYRAAGELFVTGRVKDIIIKGGRNLVPQEIEEAAGAVTGVRRGRVVAIGVMDERSGTEQLVVLTEAHHQERAERERIERDVIAAVVEAIGMPPDVVAVLPPGAIPKTPSGKLRRGATRELYESGKLARRPSAPLRVRVALGREIAARSLVKVRHRLARAANVAALGVAWAIVGPPLVAALWLLGRLLPAGRPVRRLGRTAARIALRTSGCTLHVEGAERLPRTGPLVLIANHTSFADTPTLLAALPIDFVFAAMEEVLAWRVVGTLVRRGRHPTVDRWHPHQAVADANAIVDRLRGGESVMFFPEGTFGKLVGLRPFRLGAFEAAVEARAPVVPVVLRGTRQALPADT